MARAGMNPKTLQYIRGYSEIGVTLNTYTYIGFEDASAKMLAMECSFATALFAVCLWNAVKSRTTAVADSKKPTTSQE